MKSFFFLIILTIASLANAQERFFERAIKKGREAGSLYKVEIKDGSVLKTNILKKFSKEYIIRNIETQTVNRFGDKYEGVKSFEFLPVKEVFKFIYDNKLSTQLSNYQFSFNEMITRSKKGHLYFFDPQNNSFIFYKNFYWTGGIADSLVNGDGIGLYYNAYNNIAFAVRSHFTKGRPTGRGDYVSYKFNGLDNFDSGVIQSKTIGLSDFDDGMAVFSTDGKKGFVDEDMQIRINPKYKDVLQSFLGGKAVVVNENGEETIIDKSGNFIEYTARQSQVFEQRKKAEDERKRALIENDIRGEYIEVLNTQDEKSFLAFRTKYQHSEYEFARKYASDMLARATARSLDYEVPFKEAAVYQYGHNLVKIIASTRDGSPIALQADSLYHFIEALSFSGDTTRFIEQDPFGGRRVLASISQPVSFLDKCVINATWNGVKDNKADTAWAQYSGFEKLSNLINDFARQKNINIQYLKYIDNPEVDTILSHSENDYIRNYLENNCLRATIASAQNPGDSLLAASSGEIKMKSGETYTWTHDGTSFILKTSWMDRRFSSFNEMIDEFRKQCRKRFCQ